jgi:hypothetical protein
LRIDEVNSPLVTVPHQHFVVLFRIKAEHREDKSSFAMLAGVACALVAPGLGKDRTDLFQELHFRLTRDTPHGDLNLLVSARRGDGQLSRPVAQRRQLAA